MPEAVNACGMDVDGADKAPTHLTGPASRQPEVANKEEIGDESEDSEEDPDATTDKDAAPAPSDDYTYDNVAEATVALDPNHNLKPVETLLALQARLDAFGTTCLADRQKREAEDSRRQGRRDAVCPRRRG